MPKMAEPRTPDRLDGGRRDSGFTLVELAIVLTLIGLVAGMTGTSYLRYVERARIAQAVAEISNMSVAIDGLRVFEFAPPPNSLSEFDLATPIDPWGNPYHYLRIEGVFVASPGPQSSSRLPAVAAGPPAPSKPRKDRFLKPINTDYDLYSSGPDGISQGSLESRASRDDVVRALNGAYVGLAELF